MKVVRPLFALNEAGMKAQRIREQEGRKKKNGCRSIKIGRESA